jgi:BirA family transcriptional regulator, biotin operon repressor / biotin---[acetyl-CoA-carboxylase] ligase
LPLPSGIPLLGTPFIELPSIDSTNNYALAQIHANLAQPGTCYFAHEQTSGKGQRGKSWATESGMNILLSLVLKPDFLKPFQQFQLSASVAVAARQFFSIYDDQPLKIKWPNDLYWRDKKLGGILIENIISSRPGGGNWDWAVVGIGINVNQVNFAADLKNPVSLKQITGKSFDQLELAKKLCIAIDHFYKRLMNGQSNAILEMYNEHLYKKDELVKLKKSNRIFSAIIRKVTPTGQLVVQHSIEEQFDFGEIEWLI